MIALPLLPKVLMYRTLLVAYSLVQRRTVRRPCDESGMHESISNATLWGIILVVGMYMSFVRPRCCACTPT